MPEDRLLSPEEVAERLKVQVKTIGKYVRDGTLKGVKNPRNDSLLGIKESDLEEFITGKPVEYKEDNSASSSQDGDEVNKKKAELEKIKLDKQIALETKDIKDANELRGREDRLEEREKGVIEKENGINARMELVIQGEKNLAEKQEQDKQLFLVRINRIEEEDKKHKEAIEKENAKIKERNKARLSLVDGLAQKIYNPPPHGISMNLQEQLIDLIEPIMGLYGLHPQFDELNRYIPLVDRYSITQPTVSEVRREPTHIYSDGRMPQSIKYCYKMCISIYQWMAQEPTYGEEFCRRIRFQTRQLQSLVKNKDDSEITRQQEVILGYFRAWYKIIMRWAETYQNAQKQDWTEVVDWLCQCAQILEAKLNVGVLEDEHGW